MSQPEGMHYRVVSVYTDGNEAATVPFHDRGYATKLWTRANTIPSVARCWIERRPVGEWEVCSSEIGQEFMALAPATRDSLAPKEPTDG